MNAWGISDKGKVRKQNQDVFFTYIEQEKDRAACVVCDGMGGARAGDVASKLAAESFMACAMKSLDPGVERPALSASVLEACEKANIAVWKKAMTEPECTGMGTTLVGFAVDKGSAAVVNAGDSRAYFIDGDKIERITRDHSIVEDMVRSGEITAEEARRHPGRNIITRALGTDERVTGDVFELKLEKGQCILLCSDGLTNVVDEAEIRDEAAAKNRAGCCDRLLKLALSRGAPDNVTVVLFEK